MFRTNSMCNCVNKSVMIMYSPVISGRSEKYEYTINILKKNVAIFPGWLLQPFFGQAWLPLCGWGGGGGVIVSHVFLFF